MNEIKVSMNRNGLLSKKITFKILNEYEISINTYMISMYSLMTSQEPVC